jgi:hypothetical protein
MGGLVARAAIRGSRARVTGFPPFLYVEDVATLSTPHTGTNWANACALTHIQCRDMKPASAFIKWLGTGGPQSNMGTNWTLLGASDDDTVTSGSATGLKTSVRIKIIYCSGQGLEHNVIIKKATGQNWCQRRWVASTGTWTSMRSHSPVYRAYQAARYTTTN